MADYSVLWRGVEPVNAMAAIQDGQRTRFNNQLMAERQDAQQRTQQMNTLIGEYLGQGAVNTLAPQGGPGAQQGAPGGAGMQYQLPDGSQMPAHAPVTLNQLYALDPKRAMEVQQFQQEQAQIAQQQQQAQAMSAVRKAQFVLDSKNPGTLVKTAYPEEWQKIIDMGKDPETLTPEQWRDEASQMIAFYGPQAGLSPAGDGESPFAKINPSDYTPESVAAFEASGNFSNLVAREKPGDDPNDKAFTRANVLRDEFNSLTKDFAVVDAAYGNIVATSREPSAAGDISLITSYMKMMDPASTVREGEFANAENAGGVSAKVRSMYNKLLNGERLAVEQRADFVKQAGNLRAERVKQRDKTAERYRSLAERAGISPIDVVGEVDREAAAVGSGAADVSTLSDDDLLRALGGG